MDFEETDNAIKCCECGRCDCYLKLANLDAYPYCKGCGHIQCATCIVKVTILGLHKSRSQVDRKDDVPAEEPSYNLDGQQTHSDIEIPTLKVNQTASEGGTLETAIPLGFNPPSPERVHQTDSSVTSRTSIARPTSPPSDSGYGTLAKSSQGDQKHGQENPHETLGDRHNDEDDVKTMYTETADPSDMQTERGYISMFANDILGKIGAKELDDQMIERVSSILPALLKTLALQFGHEAPSQIYRDIMVFIHKHRGAIATSLKDNHHEDNHQEDNHQEATESSERSGSTTESTPSATELDNLRELALLNIEKWLEALPETYFEDIPYHPIGDEYEGFGDDDDEDLNLLGLKEYKKLIFKNPSYAWLLDRLHVEIACSRAEPDTSREIREAILHSAPNIKLMSRKKSSETIKVIYSIDWEILPFIRSQDYGIPNSEAVVNAVTLTGTHTDAQALSCRQYMELVWPSTGIQTLQLIQEMLKTNKHKKKLIFNTPSKLILEAWIHGKSVVVSALGILDFVEEVGEQLAWLGAALRPSPVDVGIALCTPYVDQIGYVDSKMRCTIKYRIDTCKTKPRDANGCCWHYLFANPVIAQGFPIRRRDEWDTGLEAPIEVLVALARARYIDTFKSKTFVKGFSTMLVPTKQSQDALIWHLLYTEDPNERISYLDCGIEHVDVRVSQLENCRHILGWCSNAVSNVGTTRASYDVGKSKLPKTYPGCILEKVEVSGGQFVTGTAAFTLGNREKPVHISRGGYVKKLSWISVKYFIFWDEGERRGWLVNGASALLHILRASLKHSKDKLRKAWLLDPDALRDTTDPSQPESAFDVLTNESNRDLTLYIDGTDVFDEETNDGENTTKVSRRQSRRYRLEDEIEHIYNILEKLIDHQTDAERRSGLQMKIRPRRELDGWDFRDLATDGDPFFPRVATLQTIGKGWVDFTRAIQAVTLFGRDFGQLIQPQSLTAPVCCSWSSLPNGRDYLATLVSDLCGIMEKHGDSDSNPILLCDNINWHMREATFHSCPCVRGKHKCHDPVQDLFPLKFSKVFGAKSKVGLDDLGAVIFGHNMSLHWHWKDSGDPIKGNPPLQPELAPDTSNDSGLGSSLSFSGSHSASSPNSNITMGTNTPSTNPSVAPPRAIPGRKRRRSKRFLHDMARSFRTKL